ncbi:hypothetical protein D0817_05420 [Flavobacterium cupreum]|uniref:Uncharacterized protein n=1 Tax=Flavobacterium cupreum TaxID=2133766 RepID=A0A434AAF0_9FLAO|nr:hypothetical protein [Flavobacterium cupreum]RUT71316.1 hypothetical protein D0817_05420 [Flavobacterium cupreum]
MKLVGFIREHNDIVESVAYESIFFNVKNNEETIINTTNYLNNGILVLAWMGYFKDLDNGDLIAPNSYYTDGSYIWPAYFSYYLKKYPNYKIDAEFLEHLTHISFNYHKIKISDKFRSELERQLSEKMRY